MKSLIIKAPVLLFGLIIISGCANSQSTQPQEEQTSSTQESTTTTQPTTEQSSIIEISDFEFSPSTLETTIGTSITWTNKDSVPHNIVTSDELIKSPTMNQRESFSFTFDTAGTYSYICGIHPSMKGEIIVK